MKTARIFFRPIAAFRRTMSKGSALNKGDYMDNVHRLSFVRLIGFSLFWTWPFWLPYRRRQLLTAFSALGDSFRDS